MPSYKVHGDLDDYKNHLEDGSADVGEYEYADDEEDEYDDEQEQQSEEALKLLEYRQKLKEQLRSKLRKENGINGCNLSNKGPEPVLKKFGSFFGPSKPVIADRVIQEAKALLETPRLAPKSSTSRNPEKPSNSGAELHGETSNHPLNQVKTKAQILKDIRDYSFLLSDDKDIPIPKSTKETNGQNGLVPSQDRSHENERKKTSELNMHPAPPRKSSLNMKSQLDVETQRQSIKQSGTGSVRPAMPKYLPTKKPSSSESKKLSDNLVNKRVVGPAKDEISSALENLVSNGQKSVVKPHTANVINNSERKKDPHRRSESNLMKKTNGVTCKDQITLTKRSSIQSNLDNNMVKKQKVDRPMVRKHSEGANSFKKERRPEEAFADDEHDYRSIIRDMFGYRPSRYEDVDDDDDDMCMEADFDTIRREEMRSAKIAKREDEEELVKILEEERQERLRKKAKMCKVR